MHRCLNAAISLITLSISPFANAKSVIVPSHEEQEKAIFANLLSGELLPHLPPTYCINARLYAPQAGDFAMLTSFTPQEKKTGAVKIYLKAAKKVTKRLKEFPLVTDNLTVFNFKKGDLKKVSREQCSYLPEYTLSRALIEKYDAVVQVRYNTSCFSFSGGVSFAFFNGGWTRTSTVFTGSGVGPPVGPPGCSGGPTSFGNDGDTFLKRAAQAEEPQVSPQQLREER